MVSVGIEALNIFGSSAFVDVHKLARHRQLDMTRFENLLMKQKGVALPYEDPVSYAVNAAFPLVSKLGEAEKDRIEMVITCTESGIDFGKSLSTYVHHYLGLNRECRLFEIKQACYSGTAGLQTAINFIRSQVSPGAKALVVTTDISRFMLVENNEQLNMEWSFAEPSSGAGAVALLIGEAPVICEFDVGANGCYGFEVMDTCRPVPDSEAGNADLSLMAYLDCNEGAFEAYRRRVNNIDYVSSFQYLASHTPFGGMVKGAHRKMMRKFAKGYTPNDIEGDFQRRVTPGLQYCQRVGNIMGGTIFLSLASTIDNANIDSPQRIGFFSYGSGCCSEFYSGVVTPQGKSALAQQKISAQLDARYELSIEEYEQLLVSSQLVRFGERNRHLDFSLLPGVVENLHEPRLFLREINDYHRRYEWAGS